MSEDTSQSTSMSNDATVDDEPSDIVRLPIGLEIDGVRYRTVVIDEMIGIDDHNIASKKAGKNGAKGTSLILSRCIQEIEGYLDQKKNPEKMIDREIVRKMTVVDRDYLLSRIYMLGGNNDAVMAGICPRCRTPWEEDVKFTELEVVEWPVESPMQIDFELLRGVSTEENGKVTWHKKGVLRFPTGKEQEYIGGLSSVAEIFDAMFAACIVKLGDITSVDQEMMKRLASRDRKHLMQTIQLAFPGLRQWKLVTCECGRQFDINVDLTSFFDGRPSMEDKS